jgi:hypothetical protein
MAGRANRRKGRTPARSARPRTTAARTVTGREAATGTGGNGSAALLPAATPRLARAAGKPRTLDARPDAPDFRDKLFEATLVEVPPVVLLSDYREWEVPILDQGQEGACTGFGLATVANYLLRVRKVGRDTTQVSPRMFYEMARRYDEWPGEAYSGSSARGAMKGWHKHGVCAESQWPYDANRAGGRLTPTRATDAVNRPLGAYYRVNHTDLVCMHSALAEVGVLYATARVHGGWQNPGPGGRIERDDTIIGGHAFAIVAYDREGFWVQNSWGTDWGDGGFGHISYDDWLANGTDAWVARLGAPVTLGTPLATARGASHVSGLAAGYTSAELQPHIVSLGNDGRLDPNGTYGKTADEVRAIFAEDIPRITAGWQTKRILLYAHGGLVDESLAVQRVADYRRSMLGAQVYPLSFVWHSDFWSTLRNILADAVNRRRPEGFLDRAKDFMLDRLDDALEPVARAIGGKAQWDEMKENATRASTAADGGARLVAKLLADLVADDPSVEIHLAGHSAGSIFHGALLPLLAGTGLSVATCTLWAPACTTDLFKTGYAPAIASGKVGKFAMFTLTDRAEQDDTCAGIYNKSLLYLVSNAFEARGRIPLFRDGWPILGMEKWVRADREILDVLKQKNCEWVLAPNSQPAGSPNASRSTSHGGFDDDEATVQATIARITGASSKARIVMQKSAELLRGRRIGIDLQTGPGATVRTGVLQGMRGPQN